MGKRRHRNPASRSLAPFVTPSVHDAPTHSPAWQTLVLQSPFWRHFAAAAHLGQLGPPQSVSVSVPFSAPSAQVGFWQTESTHAWLLQSDALEQFFPGVHGAQEPPQSTSDSLPFVTPSLQVAAWHTPPVQSRPTQSVWALHVAPVTQGEHWPPPQSVLVSDPFFV